MLKLIKNDDWAIFRHVLADGGIKLPEPEFRFHPERRWRFDFAWPAQMVALEVEGGIWTQGRHIRAGGFVADMEKYNAAASLGWRLFRCTPKTLYNSQTLEMIEAALEFPSPAASESPQVGPVAGEDL